MTILMVHEKAGFLGGVEQFAVRQARGLTARGHRVLLAYREDTGRKTEDFLSAFEGSRQVDQLDGEVWAWAGAEAVLVHKWPSSGFLAEMPEALRSRTVRMLHDYDELCPRRHKYYAWTGTVCHRAAGPLCFFDAGFLQKTPQGLRWKPASVFFQELKGQNGYARIVVGSQFMAAQAEKNGIDPGRIVLIPPSPPLESRGVPAGDTTESGPARLLYVGQLIRGKGVDLLLRALARLPGTRLDVAGTGNAAEGLVRLAQRLGIEDRVVFHGYAAPDLVDSLYQGADVVVVPSRWPEPFGMVGLEAMARRKPVVAFAVGGIPDWLADGETGLLVRPGEVAGLARALARLAGDPGERRRMGAAAASYRASHFSFEASLDLWENLFLTLAEGGQP